ncbi:Ferric siderophore transport system, periplasmic binding protein TonB [Minicystis rosea]|nr:Ferric siderophore transport system, periplasmic binding protein TonB [Minicystis rosea]
MSSYRAGVSPVNDPLARLLRARHRDQEWLTAALVAAVLAHGLIAHRLTRLSSRSWAPVKDVPTEMVEIGVPKPEPPPPVEAQKAEEPPAPTLPSPHAAPRAPTRDTPPPPAAAQAGAVVTRQPAPDEPIDLGDGFVTGAADAYAGGATLANGTSTSAVRGRPSPSGAPGGTGSAPARAPATPGPDLSRPPTLEGRSEWRCPFPAEADEGRIDHAVVSLTVSVDATGRVTRVSVASDGGHGFGREAQRCAMGRRWTPAVDPHGAPVSGTVAINVRFDR